MKKILILVVLALLGGLVWYWRYLELPLLTPYWRANRPDLTRELSVRLAPPLELDFSRALPLELEEKLNYLVFNLKTGRVYAAKDSREAVSPASFTKLLTAMVALDVATETAMVKATEASVNKEPTILGLKVGEELTVAELVRAAIATSANDAAATLGEGVAGLYKQPLDFFLELMNQKAFLLGMRASHFANPEGYDSDQQFSTLEDLAVLVTAILENYPLVVAAGEGDRDDLVANGTHGKYYLPNWNGLLKVYPGVSGLKIAYTENAGYSTIVTASRGGKQLAAILTGAGSIEERDLAAARLLDLGFEAENLAPAGIDGADLKPRYQEWKDLVAKIKAELKVLEEQE